MIVLKKPRSRYTINIVEDDDFLSINYMEKNCSTPTKKSVIIKKDLEQWLEYLYSSGWVNQKKNA